MSLDSAPVPDAPDKQQAAESVRQIDTQKADRLGESWTKKSAELQEIAVEKGKIDQQLATLAQTIATNGSTEELQAQVQDLQEQKTALMERSRAIVEDMGKMIGPEGRFGRRAETMDGRMEDLDGRKENAEEKLEALQKEHTRLTEAIDTRKETIKAAETTIKEKEAAYAKAIEDSIDDPQVDVEAAEAELGKAQDDLEGLQAKQTEDIKERGKVQAKIDKSSSKPDDIAGTDRYSRLEDTDKFWEDTVSAYEANLEEWKDYHEQVWGESLDAPVEPDDGDGAPPDDAPTAPADAPPADADGDLDGQTAAPDDVEYNETANMAAAFDNLCVSLISDLINRPPNPEGNLMENGQLASQGRMLFLKLFLVGADDRAIRDQLASSGKLADAATYVGITFEEGMNEGKSYVRIKFGEPDPDAVAERYNSLSPEDKEADKVSDAEMGANVVDALMDANVNVVQVLQENNLGPDAKMEDLYGLVMDEIPEEMNALLEQPGVMDSTMGEIMGEIYRRDMASDNADTQRLGEEMKASLVAMNEAWAVHFEAPAADPNAEMAAIGADMIELGLKPGLTLKQYQTDHPEDPLPEGLQAMFEGGGEDENMGSLISVMIEEADDGQAEAMQHLVTALSEDPDWKAHFEAAAKPAE